METFESPVDKAYNDYDPKTGKGELASEHYDPEAQHTEDFKRPPY